jgi:hypothetical protein
VIVTDVEVPTGKVVTVKVFEVCPAGTVTFEGTAAAPVFELVRPTTAPPEGAALVRVTVPVEEVPPRTLVGETESDEIGLGGASRKPGMTRSASTRMPTFAEFDTFIIRLLPLSQRGSLVQPC